ncbi:MAG: FAD-dependent oxidoreductase [Armatimonadetes bacterium]|nr:FAD-dependent oxidoreductase [Armatimonadota bacterium]
MPAVDLVVVGGGSGGIGAALAAARLGLSVLLVERADTLGGTAVRGGVHCWQPSAGGTGIPFDIYRRLKRLPKAVAITSIGRHCLWPGPQEPYPFPGGENVVDPRRRYIETLQRCGARSMAEDEAFVRECWHGVVFEPEAYCQVVEGLLAGTGRCTVLKGATFAGVRMEGSRVALLKLSTGEDVEAAFCVDATADIDLAVACGCRTLLGQDGQDTFGEPGASEEPNDHLNAVTLIYRVTPADQPAVQPLPDGSPEGCWWRPSFPVAVMDHMPREGLTVNMLPAMEGREASDMGPQAAYDECRRRVHAHWRHLQVEYPEFRRYRLSQFAPALGVREGRRVVARYMLREQDLMAGLSGQSHDDTIAIADHGLDTHGHATGRAGCRELREPYGIPYRCLLPVGVDNLLVACRGAGFSSLAASSCRLSRTMMGLGQAAGTAAAIARRSGCDLADVRASDLRAALLEQHVHLEWPLPESLRQHLTDEDTY